MRVNINSNRLWSITSIDGDTLGTLMFMLEHIKDRGFKEYDEATDQYYSGEGIAIALSRKELRKFHEFVDGFNEELAKVVSALEAKSKRRK
ncbi:MAG: hypothetical protein FWG84_02385 [Bacteroidales bacterium]|nr:hypothetical protein [Bacteroidales bacterium]